jgi:ubiquinol-cytochrome c reductase cytochrome c1 subunit
MNRKLLLLVLLWPGWSLANVGGQLDTAPSDPRDLLSVQRGAKTFVNYCLTCHSANYMRYSRLQDLGLSEDQIKQNLLLAGGKIGDTMQVALRTTDAKQWFGVPPPDLSVIARSRGADWLYTYFRTFYRDDARPSGWNNQTFPQVGMPHVLYGLQGEQVLRVVKGKNAHGHEGETRELVLEKPGKLSPMQYDAFVADLVNYLVYMGEPARNDRIRIGMFVMMALAVLFVLAYLLKREFWKDVH